jgi:hypothetical protein
MKKNIIVILFLLALASCSGNQEKGRRKKQSSTIEDTTIPPPVSRAEAKKRNHAYFAEFWADFQEGVFARNQEKIASLTLFPFTGDFTCNEVMDKKIEDKEETDEKNKTELPKRKPINRDIFLTCIVGEFDKCLIKAIGEADVTQVERTGLIEFEYIPEIKTDKKNTPKLKNIKPSGRVTLTFKNIHGLWKFTGMYLKGTKPDNCPL